jgi:hypothetical protein
LRILPLLTVLLPVVAATASGWLPRLRGFGLGAFLSLMVAMWLPRTWWTFWTLLAITLSAAAAFWITNHLASHLWSAGLFLALVGWVAALLAKRVGIPAPLLLLAATTRGLNASPNSADSMALMIFLGGMWGLIGAMAWPRPPSPPTNPVTLTFVDHYALRSALTLGAATVLSYWMMPAHLGWIPMAAAAVMRPDRSTTTYFARRRFAASLAAVPLACALLLLDWPPWANLLVMVCLLAASQWFSVNPAYANPFVVTTIVIVLLAHAQPDSFALGATHRILATALGVAFAFAFLVVPLSRRGTRFAT